MSESGVRHHEHTLYTTTTQQAKILFFQGYVRRFLIDQLEFSYEKNKAKSENCGHTYYYYLMHVAQMLHTTLL